MIQPDKQTNSRKVRKKDFLSPLEGEGVGVVVRWLIDVFGFYQFVSDRIESGYNAKVAGSVCMCGWGWMWGVILNAGYLYHCLPASTEI